MQMVAVLDEGEAEVFCERVKPLSMCRAEHLDHVVQVRDAANHNPRLSQHQDLVHVDAHIGMLVMALHNVKL